MFKDSLKTQFSLWKQFVPLSMSDVTMAFGDPVLTAGLARLPFAQLNIAAVGLAKSVAVFFESPIIMVLHASNVMASSEDASRVLRRFIAILLLIITAVFGALATPLIFPGFAGGVLGISGDLLSQSQFVLTGLILWPAIIGFRRYFQGRLIHAGESSVIATSAFARLAVVAFLVWLGVSESWSGGTLAVAALLGGITTEALLVALLSFGKLKPITPETLSALSSKPLPHNLSEMWRFFRPLASSMMVVWGGRVLLLTIVARSFDPSTSLAAWTTAWGILLVVANSTRMVQQVVIRNLGKLPARSLMFFVISVGGAAVLLLAVLNYSPFGQSVISTVVANNLSLSSQIETVLSIGLAIPALVAVQNALQGVLVFEHRTQPINSATWVATVLLLAVAAVLVAAEFSGSVAAAFAMVSSLLAEIAVLGFALRNSILNQIFSSKRASNLSYNEVRT